MKTLITPSLMKIQDGHERGNYLFHLLSVTGHNIKFILPKDNVSGLKPLTCWFLIDPLNLLSHCCHTFK